MMLMGIYQTMISNHQFSLDYCYFSMICLGDKDPSVICLPYLDSLIMF